MSIENYYEQSEGTASADPAGLPLFTAPHILDSEPGSARVADVGDSP